MAVKPKVCVDCGNEFIPNSGVQKRCMSCRETHVVPSQTNEYRNAYRRRLREEERRKNPKPKKKPGPKPGMRSKVHITPSDPTRGREVPSKSRGELDRIGNTELGSRLRDRMNEIERESYERFQDERES